jgi:hypothetical protein
VENLEIFEIFGFLGNYLKKKQSKVEQVLNGI